MMIHLTPDHPLLDVSNEHHQNRQQQGELVDSYKLLHLHPLLDLSGVLAASPAVEVDDRAKGGGGELGNVIHEDEVGVEVDDVSYEEGAKVGEVVAGVVPLPASFWGRSKNKSGSKWGVIPRIGVLSLDLEFFRRGVIALGTMRCQRVWRLVGSRVGTTVSPRVIS
ncbi:unnamed protein product [Prunus brigantina]